MAIWMAGGCAIPDRRARLTAFRKLRTSPAQLSEPKIAVVGAAASADVLEMLEEVRGEDDSRRPMPERLQGSAPQMCGRTSNALILFTSARPAIQRVSCIRIVRCAARWMSLARLICPPRHSRTPFACCPRISDMA